MRATDQILPGPRGHASQVKDDKLETVAVFGG